MIYILVFNLPTLSRNCFVSEHFLQEFTENSSLVSDHVSWLFEVFSLKRYNHEFHKIQHLEHFIALEHLKNFNSDSIWRISHSYRQ